MKIPYIILFKSDFNEYKQFIEIKMITELENSFLYFCHTDEKENYFNNSLIYLCKNDKEGSFGIVINKKGKNKFKRFCLTARQRTRSNSQ